MKYSFLLGIAFMLIAVGCNKELRYSNKLMKGETWEVRNITVDGTSLAVFGQWKITSDVDIYDSVPRLLWTVENQDAVCEWQFQEKGKKFQLNYYQLCEECFGADLDELDYLANDLSGNYEVQRHGRNKMRFLSTQTKSFSGKTVVISIERN